MRNRIAEKIVAMEAQIKRRIENEKTTETQVKQTGTLLDMEFDEWFKFQDLRAMAQAGKFITFDESSLVYQYLGETPATFNEQPVAVKAVLTRFFSELLSWMIEEKRNAKPTRSTGEPKS